MPVAQPVLHCYLAPLKVLYFHQRVSSRANYFRTVHACTLVFGSACGARATFHRLAYLRRLPARRQWAVMSFHPYVSDQILRDGPVHPMERPGRPDDMSATAHSANINDALSSFILSDIFTLP